MTEAEWLTATDPSKVLKFLRDGPSDRKFRLFAMAACRHSLQCFGHYELDVAIDWADRSVDGTAITELPEDVRGAVEWATTEMCESLNCLGEAVRSMLTATVFDSGMAQYAAQAIIEAHQIADVDSSAANEACKQSVILRDIFGNPFRPVPFDPRWRTADVTALARGIYDEREFDRLPLLADALMDAGCDHEDVLAHCRGDGPHVRGCWVVDLVLGKE
jgi:hypothetical protein